MGGLHWLLSGYLLQCGPLHRLEGNLSSTMVSSTGWRGIPDLTPRELPSFPSSLTLVFAGLFLAHFFPSSPYCHVMFCPALNVFPKVTPAWLMGIAVSCSGSSGTICVQHRAAPAFSYRGHTCSYPAANTMPWISNIHMSWEAHFRTNIKSKIPGFWYHYECCPNKLIGASKLKCWCKTQCMPCP